MKDCSILISNRNSYEAIQLCVESILKYTKYPNCRIIVYDDNSDNSVDINYLRKMKDCGLIELVEGHREDVGYFKDWPGTSSQYWHGNSLNILINEICNTDYAVVLDCDIQILKSNWFKDLINLALKDEKTLGICDSFDKRMLVEGGYRVGYYGFWFGLLDMNIYKDGMKIDWRPSIYDRREEPYCSMFSSLYPPEKTSFYNKYCNKEKFKRNQVYSDPGGKLWIKVNYDNPKKYKVVPLPENVRSKFRHYGNISTTQRLMGLKKIKEELRKLRCQN